MKPSWRMAPERRTSFAPRVAMSGRLAAKPGDGEEILRRDADCGAGGAGADAGRPAVDARAHVALDRLLGRLAAWLAMLLGPELRRLARPRPFAEKQPFEQRRLGR